MEVGDVHRYLSFRFCGETGPQQRRVLMCGILNDRTNVADIGARK